MDKIYVYLIDGTGVYVPIETEKISDDVYRITDISSIDIENDHTAIWKFFPGDIVKVKHHEGMDIMLADELIESTFPNRRMHELIFRIVESFGDLTDEEEKEFAEELEDLKSPNCKVLQKKHPTVQKYLKKFDE